MNVSARIDHELQRLSAAMALYVRASGKTAEQVFTKKSSQLGEELRQEFKTLMPGKGSIRDERIAALKAGEGVRVRPSVYAAIADKFYELPVDDTVKHYYRVKGGKIGKLRATRGGLNFQAFAVKRELSLRESGRGFLAQSARFVGSGHDVASYSQSKAESRYGVWLAKAGLTRSGEGGSATLTWGGLSQLSDEAVKAMGRARGQAAILRAVTAVTEDMVPYLERHLGEAAVGIIK